MRERFFEFDVSNTGTLNADEMTSLVISIFFKGSEEEDAEEDAEEEFYDGNGGDGGGGGGAAGARHRVRDWIHAGMPLPLSLSLSPSLSLSLFALQLTLDGCTRPRRGGPSRQLTGF